MAVDGAGNVYVTDGNNDTIRKITSGGVVTTLAGTAGMPGSADGTGAEARFFGPTGVAVDSAGNLYVAEVYNHTLRKVTAEGVVTTLAGTAGMRGSADGTGTAARFNAPFRVAVDGAGNVYVADSGNNTIRKVTAAGIVTTLAGTAGTPGGSDGTGAEARFNNPFGVAVDGAGSVFVADSGNYTIRKVTAAGVVTTLAGTAGTAGRADGTGAAASFNSPSGVAVDSTGDLYVADEGSSTIRKITASGVVTTLAGNPFGFGSADGTGADARFFFPSGVGVDSAGNLYVADQLNSTIRKITAAGVVTTLAGAANRAGGADGIGADARLNIPRGVAVDRTGNVYVADTNNSILRKITPAGIVTTLAGAVGANGSADGTGSEARFGGPTGLAIDSAGNIYVTDQSNQTIRKVTAAGIVTTLAGTAGLSGSADGTGADARFNFPTGMAVDSAGNVYVADQFNHTLRKVTADGVVTTLAGTAGMAGSADGMGADAHFDFPTDVAADGAGNVYVADQFNSAIRKVTAEGIVTTLTGTAGIGRTSAEPSFHFPFGLAVDTAGNLYVADQVNSTIRKVTPTGSTTTVAGTAGVSGILLGATPRFASPRSLAVAGDSLVISDANAVLLLRAGAH